jgi:hypothetical protein
MTSPPSPKPPDRSGVVMAYVAMVAGALWMLLCGACTAMFVPMDRNDPSFFVIVGLVCAAPGILVFALSLRHVLKNR